MHPRFKSFISYLVFRFYLSFLLCSSAVFVPVVVNSMTGQQSSKGHGARAAVPPLLVPCALHPFYAGRTSVLLPLLSLNLRAPIRLPQIAERMICRWQTLLGLLLTQIWVLGRIALLPPLSEGAVRVYPPIPPSKRSRVREGRADGTPTDAAMTADAADAYMRSSVPVFADDGQFRTPGSAPRHVQNPSVEGPVAPPGEIVLDTTHDNLYRRASPCSQQDGVGNDEERVITLAVLYCYSSFMHMGWSLIATVSFLSPIVQCAACLFFSCTVRSVSGRSARFISARCAALSWRFAHLPWRPVHLLVFCALRILLGAVHIYSYLLWGIWPYSLPVVCL